MCAVSAVTDYYREKWPIYTWPDPFWPDPFSPNSVPVNPLPDQIIISRQQWEEYLELKKRMQEYDKRTNQPDCVKPEVADWEKAVEAVLIKRGILKENK